MIRKKLAGVTPVHVLGLIAAMILATAFGLGCSSGGGHNTGGGGGGGGGVPANGGVSGTVTLPERVQLDSDTPNPDNPQASNDTPATAQALINLVEVAGYAGDTTDPEDYYNVQLSAGEKIYLEIAGSTVNLDLYLYQGSTVLDSSTTTGQVETVTASADGNYLIEVRAVTGGSIYDLIVGLNPQDASAGLLSWSPDQDFVPGEAIVKFKMSGRTALLPAGAGAPGGVLRGAALAAARAQAEDFAAARGAWVDGFDPRGLALLGFPAPAGAQAAADTAEARAAARSSTVKKVRELGADPMVAYAEPNFRVYPAATYPNDSYYNQQWNLPLINMPTAWDGDTGSASITIAVVDTGVLYNHPDLDANILKDGSTVVGYDLISDPSISLDGDGCDPDPYDVGDKNNSDGSSSFHGTHVSGIASAATNNSKGVAGVAWKTKIMPVRVLGYGGGTYYDVVQGIYYAAGLPNACGALPMIGDTVTPANIINMSLGSTSYSTDMQAAVSAARAAGVIVVAAAGNNNSSTAFYPAALDGVVGVSAVQKLGGRASYSNYGNYVDIAAPGGDSSVDTGILSTLGNDSSGSIQLGYGFYQGTSMASPHIAGVAALMKDVFEANAGPGAVFNPLIFDALIEGTIGGASVSSITNYAKGTRDTDLGYGLIDGQKALDAALTLALTPSALDAHIDLEPNRLNFGFAATQLDTTIADRGIKPLSGVTVDPSYKLTAPWLSHTLDGSTLIFGVARGDTMADGVYEAFVTVNAQIGGSAIADITMYKGLPVTDNAGAVYVILVNVGNNAQYQVTTNYAKGYAFSFSHLTAGRYMIVAGTDINNDGTLGDNGELAGAYPDLNQPIPLLISGKILSARNFPVQFIGLPVPADAGKP